METQQFDNILNLFNTLIQGLGNTVNPNILEQSSKCVSDITQNITSSMSKILSLSQIEASLHQIALEYGQTSDQKALEDFKQKAQEYYKLKTSSSSVEKN